MLLLTLSCSRRVIYSDPNLPLGFSRSEGRIIGAYELIFEGQTNSYILDRTSDYSEGIDLSHNGSPTLNKHGKYYFKVRPIEDDSKKWRYWTEFEVNPTNIYSNFPLQEITIILNTEQAGAGYPPQGVGSPDP